MPRDPFGGVTRLVACIGNDERHRVADMTNPVARQCPARRHDHRRDCRHWAMHGNGADVVRIESAAVKTPFTPGIARAATVSMPRSQHAPAASAARCRAADRAVHVIDITPLPSQKSRVFETAQRTPD